MKILLDHNLDRRLKSYFSAHDAWTTQDKGWADVVNGKLLDLAEQNGFEVLLTADANIKNQQNLSKRKIAILVLRAFNNRLSTHAEMVEDADQALTVIQAGEIIEILHKDISGKLKKQKLSHG